MTTENVVNDQTTAKPNLSAPLSEAASKENSFWGPSLSSKRVPVAPPSPDDSRETVEAGSADQSPEAKVEPTASAVEEKAEPNQEINRLYQEIIRRDRENRKLNQQVKELQEKMEARFNELAKPRVDPKKDPLGFLEEAGLQYDDVVKSVIHKKDQDVRRDPVIDQLMEQNKKLEERLQNFEKKQEESVQEKQINDFKQQISSVIDSGGDKYAYIKAADMTDAVLDTIIGYKEQYDRSLTIDEACELVENQLEKNLADQFNRIREIPKASSIFGKSSSPSDEKTSVSEQGGQGNTPEARAVESAKEAQGHPSDTSRPKTLTNEMQHPRELPRERRLSREDRLREAARVIRWTN